MTWIHPLSPETDETPSTIGGKAHGLIVMKRLGLPVPPGFVISTAACRAYLRDGRLPDGLGSELAAAVADLEVATGAERPLTVSVRSGAGVSMPGMMDTILNLGLTAGRLRSAVTEVFSSWDTPRATTYRELHGIPHDAGTAVTVQAMVFGDRAAHSGSGVAFSRDPNTGERTPFGEVLFGHQGDDVVSGRSTTLPLSELTEREPAVWADLTKALERVERHYRDACHVEFTFEAGELWLLQVRPGGIAGGAAVRVAVDLADEGLISRQDALRRVRPEDLRHARTPRIAASDTPDLLARGAGACPGVATGKIATSADRAVRMAADGPVILVRPHTSPLDMHGLAAAAGVVTARGGPASHAAIVARAMGKPAVVGVRCLTFDEAGGRVQVAGRTVPDGMVMTIDGTAGDIAIGSPRVTTPPTGSHLRRFLEWAAEIP
ncbi:pyruvate, phosphate dikinase [Actinomadura barringtoniae]|uniref:Pyruvate, phosphate dikinase n=1 Tax=Actinomadura barringtoniae TaxID=1427535 RepID=A0A939PJR5_9ACTN|nr:PEP/pyruvate-binding domain-containing protein [Actinomadura barringtoniae]MBO2454182.1 pyruvate, phosphate dikinase [Actinomadura barringtoniae]